LLKFKQLFARISGETNWREEDYIHVKMMEILKLTHGMSADALNEVMADPTWRRIAILRDPIERFISGYMDKAVNNRCSLWRDAGDLCKYEATISDLKRFSSEEPWPKNSHFALQQKHCAMASHRNFWNTIAMYHSNTINATFYELFGDYFGLPASHEWGGDVGAMWESRFVFMQLAKAIYDIISS
jgi:hypothetical protein